MATPVDGSSIFYWHLEYLRDSQVLMSTQTFTSTVGGTIPDYQAMLADWLAGNDNPATIRGKIQAACGADVTLVRQVAQPVWPIRYAPVVRDFTPGTVGLLAGHQLPPNVSATLTKKTIQAARWGIGKLLLPAGTASEVDAGGVWTPAFQTILGAVATYWKGTWASSTFLGDMVPVLWSKRTPTRVTRLVNMLVQATCRVVRRRTVGVGK